MIDMSSLTKKGLAAVIDQTFLDLKGTRGDFEIFCAECRRYGFRMAAINSAPTALCSQLLKGSGVRVGAAVSFPFGQTTVEAKLFEAKNAIENGADDIDYVVNLSELKSGNWKYIEDEIHRMRELCSANGIVLKVIFENCYLTYEEKERLCRIAARVRPDYVKTSTGFGPGGATAEDVKLMCGSSGVKVKAAARIRSWQDCLNMLEAGAECIGTRCGVKILEEFDREAKA